MLHKTKSIFIQASFLLAFLMLIFVIVNGKVSAITRDRVMNNAYQYLDLEWEASAGNISSSTCGGTASWITAGGEYTAMAYAWGGDSAPDEFLSGLENNKLAGHNNWSTCNYSVGVDCSGFVSNVWELGTHPPTYDLMTTAYTNPISYDDLKRGDILIINGHVRLYEKRIDSELYFLEATTTGYKVRRASSPSSSLSSAGYQARRYKNIEDASEKIAWDFQGKGLLGWGDSTKDISAIKEVSDGIFFTVEGNDPYLSSPLMQNVNADNHQYLHIRMANQNDHNTNARTAQIFFKRYGDTTYSESRSVFFTFLTGTAYDYFVDMSQNVYWQGQITQLRFDVAGEQNPDPLRRGVRIEQIGFVTGKNTWDFSLGRQGWGDSHYKISSITEESNGIFFKSIGDDTYILSPILEISANNYSHMLIRMANQNDQDTNARTSQIFFKNDGDGSFTESKKVSFTHNGGGTNEYIIDMAQNPNWTGDIKQIRFDTNGAKNPDSDRRGIRIEEITLFNQASLSVDINELTDPVNDGDNINYTVNVLNAGTLEATNVVVSDQLASGLSLISITPSQGTCSEAAGLITCNLGTLAASGNANITMSVGVNTAITGNMIINSVDVLTGGSSITSDTETTFVVDAGNTTNSALDFDGADDYVNAGDIGTLGDSFTIEAWIKPGPGNTVIFEHGNRDPYSTHFQLSLRDAQVKFFMRAPDSGSSAPTIEVRSLSTLLTDKSTWYHVAAVRNGSNIYIYLNGQFENSGSNSSLGTMDPGYDAFIGAAEFDTGKQEFFNGLIDEVRVWDLVRSQTQIQDNMYTDIPAGAPGLVANWQMNLGSGQHAVDYSQNEHHGQLGSSIGADTNDPDWVEEEIVNYDPPGTPTITYPVAEIYTDKSFDVTLTPGQDNGRPGSSVLYHVQFDNNSDFSSPEFDNSGNMSIDPVNVAVTLGGTYYLKVRQFDGIDLYSNWTGTVTFSVIGKTYSDYEFTRYAQDASKSRVGSPGWRPETAPLNPSYPPRSNPAYWTKPGTGYDWIRWNFSPSINGKYEMWAYIPSLLSSPAVNTRSAKYSISYEGGQILKTKDQQDTFDNPGNYTDHSFNLGTYDFSSGNTYSVELTDNTGESGEIAIAADTITWKLNVAPEIKVTDPDGVNDPADTSYIIEWVDDDPDDNASISLYYDTDASGEDGVLITGGINEDDPGGSGEINSYTWDTSALPNGDYYIYGVINDGVNTPGVNYSNGPISISRTLPNCTVALCNPSFEDGLDYWVTKGDTSNQISNDAIDGINSLRSEHTRNTNQEPSWAGLSQSITSAEPAQTYGISMWAKSLNASRGHVKIMWYDSGGTVSQVDYPIININGTISTWTSFSKLVTSPPDAVSAELFIWHGINASSQNVQGSTLWIDNIEFDVATTSCGTLCNENFEQGLLYWTVSGAVGSHNIETTGQYEGLKTAKSEQMYTSLDEAKWAGVTQFAQVKEGVTYRLRTWMKINNASNGHVRIRWRDSAGNLLSTQYPIAGINGTNPTWFKRAAALTAPANAAKAEVTIWHGVNGGVNVPGSIIWIDDITLICESLCNGGFENGMAHWEINGQNDGEVQTTGAYEGAQAIKITQNLDAGYNTQWAGISQRTLVTGGNSYNLAFRLKKENAVQGHVKIKWRDSNDTLISQQFPIGGISGTNLTWAQMHTTLTAPVTAETVEIFIWHGVDISNDNAIGSTLYLDNVTFTQI